MLERMLDIPEKLPAIALSYGLEAMIGEKVGASGGRITIEMLVECALRLYPESVVQKNIDDLSSRFVQRVERLAKTKSEEPETTGLGEPSKPKRTLGASLQEWTQSLDPTGICLYLADYDPERAHRLYWWVEADLLELTLHSKLRFESTKQINLFEASMYGFGGKYAGDEGSSSESDDSSETFDLNTAEGRNALSGFMGINF